MYTIDSLRRLSFGLHLLALCFPTALALAGTSSENPLTPSIANGHWIDTWTSMPQLTEPDNLPGPPYNGTGVVFQNSTIRQTVQISLGAQQIRLRVSNAFGTGDLPISAMTVARPLNGAAGQSAILPETLQTVTFSGETSYIVPNGAQVVSDPLDFEVASMGVLAVTMYLEKGQRSATNVNTVTSHPGSRTTSWYTFGNQVSATNLTGSTLASVAHWFFISAVEAWAPPEAGALSIIGDSITDGRGSTTDANNRWPDQLLARMQQSDSTTQIAIANQAAGGNRILADGLGPNVLARVDRDVLAHPGTRYALIFEGVNDIGVAPNDTASQAAIHARLIAAYKQIITRVHASGLPVFGATITPFSAPGAVFSAVQPYSDVTREGTRQKVNAWIREGGAFDYVVDFDAMMRDPARPETLDARYDSGDYLHPNPAGYARMAEDFPVEAFAKFKHGVSGF